MQIGKIVDSFQPSKCMVFSSLSFDVYVLIIAFIFSFATDRVEGIQDRSTVSCFYRVRASFQGAKLSHFFLEGEQGVFLFLTYTCKISVKATITLRHFERQGTIFLTFAADRFEAGIQCQRSVSCLNCASVAFMTQNR